jgi:hypothetical protein
MRKGSVLPGGCPADFHADPTPPPPAPRRAPQADAEAAQAQAAHTASERDAEAEAARQHAARVRRLEEQLGEAAAAAERTRAAAAAPAGGGDQELQVGCCRRCRWFPLAVSQWLGQQIAAAAAPPMFPAPAVVDVRC